ncbi:flippase [Vibrio cholerae]|uniref:flippase n=1 Tax=Vibrio cholerae TaxID=666 RepID=UPI003F9A30AA
MKHRIKNAMWMLLEKIFSAFGVIFLNILVARSLGPEKWGVINYALAITSMIIPVAQMGSQNLLFDKIVRNRNVGVKLLIASSDIRKVIYIALAILSLVVIYYFNADQTLLIVFIMMAISGYFTAIDAYTPYFDATLKSKVNSIASQVSLSISFILRFILISITKNVLLFTIPYVLYTGIVYFIKRAKFYKEERILNNFNRRKYRKYALQVGFPLMLSNVSIIIYLKISQIILTNIEGVAGLGVYSAAVTISQGWLFLPTIIITTLLAKAITMHKQKGFWFTIVFVSSLAASVPIVLTINFFNEEIIFFTFGEKYLEAANIISVLTTAALFSIIGTVSYRIIIHYGGYQFLMKKMVFLALFNIFLSYYMIGKFGMMGAAYSMLITEIVSATIVNYLYTKTSIVKIHSLFYLWSFNGKKN